MQNLKIYFIVIITLVATSCVKKNEVVVMETGYKYFPIEKDLYLIYEVDSITIQSALALNDSAHYFIKEVHDSLYVDASGTPSVRIVRYKKRHLSEDWQVNDIWTAHRNASMAMRVEENLRTSVMSFPIRDYRSWNRNAFNPLEERTMNYSRLHESYQLGELAFDSVVEVQFDEEINLIERNTGNQIFASNVGMIQSEINKIKLIDITPVEEEITWEQIELGVLLKFKLIDYGKE